MNFIYFSYAVKYYSSFDIFAQPFRNVTNMLSSLAIQKQVSGRVWSSSHSLLPLL